MLWIKIAGKVICCAVLPFISSTSFFFIYITSQNFGQVTILPTINKQHLCLRYAPKIWANYIFRSVLPNTTVHKFFVIFIGQNFKKIDIFGQFCHASAAAFQIFDLLHIKIWGSFANHQHYFNLLVYAVS